MSSPSASPIGHPFPYGIARPEENARSGIRPRGPGDRVLVLGFLLLGRLQEGARAQDRMLLQKVIEDIDRLITEN